MDMGQGFRILFHKSVIYSNCERGIQMKSVYVGNLPYATTETELRELFERHGKVFGAQIKTDRDTGRPLGYGFVLLDEDEAPGIMQAMDGSIFCGRTLRVNESRERKKSTGIRHERNEKHSDTVAGHVPGEEVKSGCRRSLSSSGQHNTDKTDGKYERGRLGRPFGKKSEYPRRLKQKQCSITATDCRRGKDRSRNGFKNRMDDDSAEQRHNRGRMYSRNKGRNSNFRQRDASREKHFARFRKRNDNSF